MLVGGEAVVGIKTEATPGLLPGNQLSGADRTLLQQLKVGVALPPGKRVRGSVLATGWSSTTVSSSSGPLRRKISLY